MSGIVATIVEIGVDRRFTEIYRGGESTLLMQDIRVISDNIKRMLQIKSLLLNGWKMFLTKEILLMKYTCMNESRW